MNITKTFLALFLPIALNAQVMTTPPKAEKQPETMSIHGDTRIDDYFWMRLSDEQKEAEKPDAQTQKVLDYLNAENAFLKQEMKSTEGLQKKLYDEMVGRIKQDDESVPYIKNGYSYYTRYEKGADYPLYCRKGVEAKASESILLNGPEMAKGLAYFAVGGYSVSPNNEILAYSVDVVSRREYTIYFKDLVSGKIYEDKIANTTGGMVWANDNKTVFYTKKDPVTLRSSMIYKHVIGTDSKNDELVFEEKDETFSCSVYKTKSEQFLIIGSWQTVSTEYRILDANDPSGEWKIFQPRERNLEYSIYHFENDFYIVTNEGGAKNFKLMKTPINATDKKNWKEVIAHRKDVLLEEMEIFQDYYVLAERMNGLNQLKVVKWSDESSYYIEFDDPTYMAYISTNPEYTSKLLRFGYTSLTTPNSTYDFNMETKGRELLKRQEIMDKDFKPENYTSERLMATSRDGVKVPISLVYKKGLKLDANTPLLLYGYGSYGASMDAYFSSSRLSLLDRGFVFAIAHIRGGQEMGREWYEDGKLLNKKNTFNDFIDCGEFLISNNYTSNDHLYAMGGSAGGLLMGAIINMRPDLWHGVVAAVPFVDVISTMLDESIPLTTGEFDEWGNPKDETYYNYMKSYSPYDNIEKKDYPNLLITTGYWDSQVQYWEPAKWIAKLREYKTDDNYLLMHCNMDVGHGGASGRFEQLKEVAMEYAFLLMLEGISE